MAARTRLLQMAVVVINIVIVGLVFSSIWPFPSGDFNVHLPSAHEVTWTYTDGVVHVVAPFSIDNGWIYDVDDLTVAYSVTNGSGAELAGQTIVVGDIPAGRITSSQLDFEFNLLEQYGSGIDWMIFHEDMLYFFIEVSCWYTMKLIQFDATYQVSVPWDALIQDLVISDYSLTYPPPTATVSYWLNTSHLLSGLPAADVTISYLGDGSLLGQAQTTIELGGAYSGAITMGITPAIASTYTFVLNIQFGGFTITRTYEATAPPVVIP
jgi:hypothetical protein